MNTYSDFAIYNEQVKVCCHHRHQVKNVSFYIASHVKVDTRFPQSFPNQLSLSATMWNTSINDWVWWRNKCELDLTNFINRTTSSSAEYCMKKCFSDLKYNYFRYDGDICHFILELELLKLFEPTIGSDGLVGTSLNEYVTVCQNDNSKVRDKRKVS